MDRKTALVVLRVAGYHGDSRAWLRTYVEHRISRAVADAEWARGQSMRSAGVPCGCRACKPT